MISMLNFGKKRYEKYPLLHFWIFKPNNLRTFLLLWQVFNDATKFIKLCEQLNVVPDIWSLYEWSIWLTPTWKRTKRFETVFYLVGVDEQPVINVKNNEVHDSWVISSQDIQIRNQNFHSRFLIYSGVRQMNCCSWIGWGKIGCLRHNCTSCHASAMNQISINCCHSQKHVAPIHQRH